METRQKVATGLKWVAGIIGAAVVAPVIFLALKAALGLLALGVAAAVGLVMLRLAPAFGQFTTNLGLKLFKLEVGRNPIESMESLYMEKMQEADNADCEVVEFDTEIRNYDGQRKTFEKQYPEEASTFAEISVQMHEALTTMKEEQVKARAGLVDLQQRIYKAKAIYAMSLAAQRVAQLSKTAEKKVFQEIKEKVAFDTVQTQLNKSFASLNMAVARRKTINTSSSFSAGRKVEVGAA